MSLNFQRQHSAPLLILLEEGPVDDSGDLGDFFLGQRELELERTNEHEQKRLHSERVIMHC